MRKRRAPPAGRRKEEKNTVRKKEIVRSGLRPHIKRPYFLFEKRK
jgi:hypothetical protein